MPYSILKKKVKDLNNKGFTPILIILIMAIIFISLSFLIYISNTEYLISNSNKNSIQSYYLREGKMLKLLYQDKYYNDEILPRIKRYLKFGFLGTDLSNRFYMDEEDLIEGDTLKTVEMSFSIEENRRLMTLQTSAIFNGVTKTIQAKANIVKGFYELGNPILYDAILNEGKKQDYIEYMNYVEKNIGINQLDNDIMGIESINFDNIVLFTDVDNRKCIEFYRNTIDNPIKYEYINKDKIFLLIKGPTNLLIESRENSDKLILNGIVYTEGDVNINNDIDFNGIIILNQGKINLSPNAKFKFQGIILSRDYPFEVLNYGNELEIEYNENYIKTNGIYLPGYIELNIKVLKDL
jgi:hypothetical protein